MNHQVEHDAHLGAAAGQAGTRRRILGEAVRLDEAGVGGVFFEEIHRRIEPFNVADREDDAVFFRAFDHLHRFRNVGGQRFFHEDVLAHFQQRHGGGVVVVCRNGDAERLALSGEFTPVVENLEPEFRTDLLRGLLLNVEDSDHFRVRTLGIQPGMVAAEGADADDTDFKSAVIFNHESFLRTNHGCEKCFRIIYTFFSINTAYPESFSCRNRKSGLYFCRTS